MGVAMDEYEGWWRSQICGSTTAVSHIRNLGSLMHSWEDDMDGFGDGHGYGVDGWLGGGFGSWYFTGNGGSHPVEDHREG